MNTERLILQGRLEVTRKEFQDASNTADDIVKTIINHIRPVAGRGTDYLNEINLGKLEVQLKHLMTQLRRRTALKGVVRDIEKELG